MKKIILIGAGGHCKVVLDTILGCKKYEVVGIIDKRERIGEKVLRVPIIGDDRSLAPCFKKGVKNCFISVGCIGDPTLRIRLFMLAKRTGFNFPNIIHPSAIISKYVNIGEGNYLAAGVIVNAGAKIGNNCILNTGAKVDHDCDIGDFVHIAPGAVLSGGVKIGYGSHIGTASSIMQYLKVGKNSLVGMGSVVINDVQDDAVICGNPCKRIK